METISMSQRERHRLEAFARVCRGEITLVKALRREKISDLAAANLFLQRKCLPTFNRRFAKKAVQSADLHRCVPRGVDADLHQKLVLAGRSVTICRRLDRPPRHPLQ